MVYSYGNSYGMPMTGGANMMSGMNAMGGSGNVQMYFKQKYGCDDCFQKEPYWQEYPKPILPVAQESIQPSFWRRLLDKIMG